jgi:hypothetical protein
LRLRAPSYTGLLVIKDENRITKDTINGYHRRCDERLSYQ